MCGTLQSVAISVWACMFFVAVGLGQGLPQFHTIQNLGPESIDVSSLNVVINAPIHSKGAGMFSFGININSSPVLVEPTFREAHTGGAGFQTFQGTCPNGTKTTSERFWTYTDANGTVHKFPSVGSSAPIIDTQHCLTQVLTGVTTDQSGYTLVINPTTYVPTVYDNDGGSHTPTSFIDANGNTVSSTNNVWTDVLAETALSQVGSTNTSVTYGYTDAAGHSQDVVVSDGYTTWQTACNSNTNTINAITKISYPDGTYLQMTYEPTTTGSTHITGRFASITLRTGGLITYTYSGGTSGINCTSNTTAILKRTTSDGTWTFDTTNITGSTVVTDPSGNDTVYTFINGLEIYRQAYQGSHTNGTLLSAKGTCYNGAAPNCSGQATVPSSVTSIDVYTYIPGVSNPSRVTKIFDTYGNIASVSRYDYGASSFTSQTNTIYGSWNGTSCAAIGSNIVGKPCDVSVTDGTNIRSHSRFTYNGNGSLLSEQGWTGSTWLPNSETYNSNGTLATYTDVTGTVTTFGYANGCNNFVVTGVSVDGLNTTKTWNCDVGAITTASDFNGNSTTAAYAEPMLRTTQITDPLSNLTNITYTSNSVESSMVFNSNSSTVDTVTTVDSLGRLSLKQKKQSPGSSSYDTVQTGYSFNSTGLRTTLSEPCVASVGVGCSTPVATTTQDALGRPLITTDGGSGTVTRVYSGRDVTITLGPAPVGEVAKVVQQEYNGLGQLMSVCNISSATGSGPCGQDLGGTGFVTKYNYNVIGQVASIIYNAQSSTSQTHSFTYDSLGRKLTATYPESGETTYTYDSSAPGDGCGSRTSLGDLLTVTYANGLTNCFEYDPLHRLTDVGNSAESTSNFCKRFRYDSTGHGLHTAPSGFPTSPNAAGYMIEAETDNCINFPNVAAITDEWFAYDKKGRLTDVWESTPNSGGYYHSTAGYFSNGALQTISALATFSAWTLNVDGEGRPYSATNGSNGISSVQYDASSNPTLVKVSTGDQDSYSYDPNTERMTNYTYTVGAAGTSMSGTLHWNENGTLQQLAITDGFFPAGTQTCNYYYDELARLGGKDGSGDTVDCGSKWAQTFSYDPFNNLTKSGSSAWMPGYNQSNNRYQNGSIYDGNGHLTYDTFNSYTWNVYNQPATIIGGNATPTCGSSGTCLTYDAFGRVVEKNAAGAFAQLFYEPAGTAAFDGQSLQERRIPLPGGLTSDMVPGSGFIWHKDWLGSVRLISQTSTRSVTTDRAFAPYGEVYNINAGSSSPQIFTGDPQDSFNGLYDTPARELHPAQGRWISPDPAHHGNAYAYSTNPLSFVDPSGADEEPPAEETDQTTDDGTMSANNSLVFSCSSDSCGDGGIPDIQVIAMTEQENLDNLETSTDNDALLSEQTVSNSITLAPATGGGSSSTNILDVTLAGGGGEDVMAGNLAQGIFQGNRSLWSSASGTMNLATGVYATAFAGVLATPAIASAALAAGNGIASTAGYYIGYSQAWLAGTGGVLLGKYISSTQNYMLDAQELGLGYFNLGTYGWRVLNYLGGAQAANQGFIDSAVQRGPIYLGTLPVGATGSYAWELQYLFSLGVEHTQIIPAWQW